MCRGNLSGNDPWEFSVHQSRQLPPRPHHVGLAPLPQSTAGRWAVFLFLFIKPTLSLERGLLLPGDGDASTQRGQKSTNQPQGVQTVWSALPRSQDGGAPSGQRRRI